MNEWFLNCIRGNRNLETLSSLTRIPEQPSSRGGSRTRVCPSLASSSSPQTQPLCASVSASQFLLCLVPRKRLASSEPHPECGHGPRVHDGSASLRPPDGGGDEDGEGIVLPRETLSFSVSCPGRSRRERRGRGSPAWGGGSGSEPRSARARPEAGGPQGFTPGAGGSGVRGPDSAAR